MTSEILTVEQFALRLTMSRTTLFEWLKTGILVQGKHYFKVGRILRFVWDETMLLTIHRHEQQRPKRNETKKDRQTKGRTALAHSIFPTGQS